MSPLRDPEDMSPMAPPSEPELSATDRLLDQLAAGRSDEPSPSVSLLRAAAGPATGTELADPTGVLDTIGSSPMGRRRSPWARLAGRTVAAKVAVIAAVAMLGVAGAGAATGLVIEFSSRTPPSTTTRVPEPLRDGAGTPQPSRSQTSMAPSSPPDGPAGDAGADAFEPQGPQLPADSDGLAPAPSGNPTPGPNGNNPNAGGNPTPGPGGNNPTPGPGGNNPKAGPNNPNAGGNNPNAGGNPSPGPNNPNAGGNPAPGPGRDR